MFASQTEGLRKHDALSICLLSLSRNSWVEFLICMEFYICNLQHRLGKSVGADDLWPAIEKDFADYFRKSKDPVREIDRCLNQLTCIKSVIDEYHPMGEIACHLQTFIGLLGIIFEFANFCQIHNNSELYTLFEACEAYAEKKNLSSTEQELISLFEAWKKQQPHPEITTPESRISSCKAEFLYQTQRLEFSKYLGIYLQHISDLHVDISDLTITMDKISLFVSELQQQMLDGKENFFDKGDDNMDAREGADSTKGIAQTLAGTKAGKYFLSETGRAVADRLADRYETAYLFGLPIGRRESILHGLLQEIVSEAPWFVDNLPKNMETVKALFTSSQNPEGANVPQSVLEEEINARKLAQQEGELEKIKDEMEGFISKIDFDISIESETIKENVSKHFQPYVSIATKAKRHLQKSESWSDEELQDVVRWFIQKENIVNELLKQLGKNPLQLIQRCISEELQNRVGKRIRAYHEQVPQIKSWFEDTIQDYKDGKDYYLWVFHQNREKNATKLDEIKNKNLDADILLQLNTLKYAAMEISKKIASPQSTFILNALIKKLDEKIKEIERDKDFLLSILTISKKDSSLTEVVNNLLNLILDAPSSTQTPVRENKEKEEGREKGESRGPGLF